ncbi:MAG: NfeD family protein [Thermodesulfobacteriota bacterium]
MEFKLLYWHWLIFGAILIICEIFIPSFTIFWFGLAGVLVAALLWVLPSLKLSWQLLVWALASIGLAVFWFRYIKPRMTDNTKAGIPREAVLGQGGLVISEPVAGKRGVVRFSAPLIGADEWMFICNQEVATGDRVFVTDISGNTLIVEKRDR